MIVHFVKFRPISTIYVAFKDILNNYSNFAGCPNGLDPMVTTNQIAAKGITLYLVGCEPSIIPYKEFFSAIAHLTGGQYVPLKHAKLLTQV